MYLQVICSQIMKMSCKYINICKVWEKSQIFARKKKKVYWNTAYFVNIRRFPDICEFFSQLKRSSQLFASSEKTRSSPTTPRGPCARAAGVNTRVFARTLLAFVPYDSPGAVRSRSSPRHTYLRRVWFLWGSGKALWRYCGANGALLRRMYLQMWTLF